MDKIPNRRPCITEKVGKFAVTVSFMPDKRAKDLCGTPIEMFVTKRGRSGTELEEDLYDLGTAASKLMQKAWRDGNDS